MDIDGYIGFLTGKPVIWVPLLILLVSAALEIFLLFIFSCTKNKRKTVYVITGTNLGYVFISELLFKILYGTWFTSVYRGGLNDFYIRLICSLVVVLTMSNVFLRKEIVSIRKFNIVLCIGIIAAAILSLGIEGLFI